MMTKYGNLKLGSEKNGSPRNETECNIVPMWQQGADCLAWWVIALQGSIPLPWECRYTILWSRYVVSLPFYPLEPWKYSKWVVVPDQKVSLLGLYSEFSRILSILLGMLGLCLDQVGEGHVLHLLHPVSLLSPNLATPLLHLLWHLRLVL